MTRLTVLVGAPQARSAVRTAAIHAADTLAAYTGAADPAEARVIDLAELGSALLDPVPSPALAGALDQVCQSDLLLVASPQRQGSYTGLLKVFVDRLPELALAQTVAVPLSVVADLRTVRSLEDDLRVLLADLGAWVSEPGLVVADSELAEPCGVIDAWAEVAAPALGEAFAARA